MAKKKVDKAAKKAAKAQAKADKKAGKAADSDGQSSGSKLGLIISPLILGGVTFGTVYFLPSPAPVVQISTIEKAEEHDTSDEIGLPDDLSILELSEITVSIRNDNQILRIGIALEAPYNVLSSLNPEDPRLRDAFMGYLRAIDASQLNDPAFMAQLRDHLLRRSRLVLGNSDIHSILITDFLVR